jgi:DNA-binding GntR family transcriptional regulator
MSASLRIAKRPLERLAGDTLREEILSCRLPPGTRLVETALAEQLAVSRGTVRAALRDLEHEGLVAQVAYTKWMVPALTPEDAWELYTLRAALEGLAARLAAGRADAAARQSLTEAMARLAEAARQDRRGTAAAADGDLHAEIVAMAGHRRLSAQYALIAQEVRRYIAASSALLVDIAEMIDQHAPIVDAILAGDADRAERLARDHNLGEGAKLHAHVSAITAGGAVAAGPAAAT